MSKSDPEVTLREFKDYFAGSYEAMGKLAKRVGITSVSLRDLVAGHREPSAKTIAKMRLFLDAESKRNRSGNGIKPTDPVPIKIIEPLRFVFRARLCPFCRKARGEIRPVSRKQFHGICPKCGATGPRREHHQEALRAWNGRMA